MRKSSLTLAFLSLFALPIIAGDCFIQCVDIAECDEDAIACAVDPGDEDHGPTLICTYSDYLEIISCRGDVLEEG